MTAQVDPPAHKLYYDELFKLADVDGDGVIGIQDAAFFRKSGLPNPVLGEIWMASDARKLGRLDREGFVVALKLISLAQQGSPPTLDSLRMNPVPLPPKLAEVPPMRNEAAGGVGGNVLSPQERKQYQDMFRTADDDADGFITGAQARALFETTGLPFPVLGQIWALADMNKDQKLDLHEFTIAMVLINNAKRGVPPPASLPEQLIQSTRSVDNGPPAGLPVVAASPVVDWTIPPVERVKFEDLFNKTDTDKDGFINGEQARAVFLRSGLPMPDLGRIWTLADANQDQKLDRQEFAVAMFLIAVRLKGRELPPNIPEPLLVSSRPDFNPSKTSAPVAPVPEGKDRYNINLGELASDIQASNLVPVPIPDILSPGLSSVDTRVASPNLFDNAPQNMIAPPSVNPLSPPAVGRPNFAPPSNNPQGFVPPPGQQGFPPGAAFPQSGGLISQPGGFAPYGSMPQSVPQNAADLERARATVMEQERSRDEALNQLQQDTSLSSEASAQLAEEQRKAELIAAEIREVKEKQAKIKDDTNMTRVDIKNAKAQAEQLNHTLKEKNEQLGEQQEILHALQTELSEKNAEIQQLTREVEQAKASLEAARAGTTDTKNQLATAKKQISDLKVDLSDTTTRRTSMGAQQAVRPSSPAVVGTQQVVRPSSPAVVAPMGSAYSPIAPARTTGAAPSLTSIPSPIATPQKPGVLSPLSSLSSIAASLPKPVSSPTVSSPVITSPPASNTPALELRKPKEVVTPTPHNSIINNNPPSATATNSFFAQGNDTFSFDNGSEDPFSFPSKDGFGFGQSTKDSFGKDSFGSPPKDSFGTSPKDAFGMSKDFGVFPAPSPPSKTKEIVNNSSFFGATSGSDAFGGGSDPFASAFDAPDSFGSFGKSDSFGQLPPPLTSSAIASVSKPLPPTPAKTESSAFSSNAPGFGDTASFDFAKGGFGSEDAFGSDSFGTNDAFGSASASAFGGASFGETSTHDSFGETDAFGNAASFSNSSTFGATDAFGSSAFGSTTTADSFGHDPFAAPADKKDDFGFGF